MTSPDEIERGKFLGIDLAIGSDRTTINVDGVSYDGETGIGKLYLDALSRISALLERVEWRDIETAPTHQKVWIRGGEIDYDNGWCDQWEPMNEPCLAERDPDDGWLGEYRNEYGKRTHHRYPTHWAPNKPPVFPQPVSEE